MTAKTKLVLLKTLHTLIWVFFNVVIFYMLYAAVINRLDKWLWIGFGFCIIEGLVLLAFRFTCPLTIAARRYTKETRDNFDIYLPEWLARHTKRIYSSLVFVIVLIVLFRLWQKNNGQ